MPGYIPKVFGNEDRLGKHAREFTVEGRLRNDPELVFWRGVDGAWSKAAARAYDVSWNKLHLPNFPGIERILKTKRRYIQEAKDVKLGKRRREQLERKSRAAGRWAYVLKWVLRVAYEARLAKGTAAQKRTLRELHALEKCQKLLSIGRHRVRRILCRLEDLTRYRLYTKTRVLMCTIDSSAGILRKIERWTAKAARAIGKAKFKSSKLQFDTVIMDEVGVSRTHTYICTCLVYRGVHAQLSLTSAVWVL